MLACTFVLLYSIWPARNAKVFGAWIPTRTTVGLELWMGNHPGSDGYLNQSLFPSYNRQELANYRAMGEVAYMAHKQQLALAFIRTRPSTFLRLTCTRILRFWLGSGSRFGSPWYIVHATVTSLLGFAGLCMLYRSHQRSVQLILIPVLLFPLPYYITHAEFRYRLILDPVLAAVGARALDFFITQVRLRCEIAMQ